MTAACVVAAFPIAERRLGDRLFTGVLALVAVTTLSAPLGLTMAAVSIAGVALRHNHRQGSGVEHEDLIVAELVVLGLRGGLSFMGALQAARREVTGPVGDQIDAIVRRAHSRGIARAFERVEGDLERFAALCGRAIISGAPLEPAVRAYVAERRDEMRAQSLAAARRLPVRMLFPLALLILPGFVVLTLGPALLSALDRLQTGL